MRLRTASTGKRPDKFRGAPGCPFSGHHPADACLWEAAGLNPPLIIAATTRSNGPVSLCLARACVMGSSHAVEWSRPRSLAFVNLGVRRLMTYCQHPSLRSHRVLNDSAGCSVLRAPTADLRALGPTSPTPRPACCLREAALSKVPHAALAPSGLCHLAQSPGLSRLW